MKDEKMKDINKIRISFYSQIRKSRDKVLLMNNYDFAIKYCVKHTC